MIRVQEVFFCGEENKHVSEPSSSHRDVTSMTVTYCCQSSPAVDCFLKREIQRVVFFYRLGREPGLSDKNLSDLARVFFFFT